MNFSYINPTQIFFGKGQIAAITQAIPINAKVLFVYGYGSIKKNGVYDQVINALKNHTVVEFAGIEPNPTIETLDKAVEIVRLKELNFILAVGGGSIADGCKYIAAASLYKGDGWDIVSKKHIITESLPIGVILTLPATGSESNINSVISCKATQDKMGFKSTLNYPKFAVLDPDSMITLPKKQLENGIADAFVHVCEQFLTYPVNAKVQDGYAQVLLRNLVELAQSFDLHDKLNEAGDNWRETLMWTANQALNGLIGQGVPQDWATHMLGYGFTSFYGLDHACTLSIIQPSLLRSQLIAKKDKLEQIGQTVFLLPKSSDLAQKTICAIEDFYLSLNMPISFNAYEGDKKTVVNKLVAQLEKVGSIALGEKQEITLDISRSIYNDAVN